MKKVGVVAIVEHDGKFLIGKKIKKEGHFLSEAWHIPGGKVEEGETDEQAIIREMQEEAGIKVAVKNLIQEYPVEKANIQIKWYLCKAETTDITPGDDLQDAKFVPKSTIFENCDDAATKNWPTKVLEYFRS